MRALTVFALLHDLPEEPQGLEPSRDNVRAHLHVEERQSVEAGSGLQLKGGWKGCRGSRPSLESVKLKMWRSI